MSSPNWPAQYERASTISGLYLWPSLHDRQLFEVSTGDFHLRAVTLVHGDEEELADASTPPHLLLAMKECGYLQPCDPGRASIREHPRFVEIWNALRQYTHDEAFRKLCS